MCVQTSSYFVTRTISALRYWIFLLAVALVCTGTPAARSAQEEPPAWTGQEKPIAQKIRELRQLPDDARGGVTRQIAKDIRKLPGGRHKIGLATALATRSTEGDFGRETLQETATTLAEALRETPAADAKDGSPGFPYVELAQLIHYEHVQVTLDAVPLQTALTHLAEEDKRLQDVDFTLQDLSGQKWTLKGLKGKVVVVNFWATWCQPCRKEMPDLESLYKKNRDKGLLVLAISDEDAVKVTPFIKQQDVKYPVLLDTSKEVHKLYHIEGLPRTFVYDRSGKLAAQAIDMRTKKQFQQMLELAGL